jgi:hypothetical protein
MWPFRFPNLLHACMWSKMNIELKLSVVKDCLPREWISEINESGCNHLSKRARKWLDLFTNRSDRTIISCVVEISNEKYARFREHINNPIIIPPRQSSCRGGQNACVHRRLVSLDRALAGEKWNARYLDWPTYWRIDKWTYRQHYK